MILANSLICTLIFELIYSNQTDMMPRISPVPVPVNGRGGGGCWWTEVIQYTFPSEIPAGIKDKVERLVICNGCRTEGRAKQMGGFQG